MATTLSYPEPVASLYRRLHITTPDQMSNSPSQSPSTVASSQFDFSPTYDATMGDDIMPKIEETDDGFDVKLSPDSEEAVSPISDRSQIKRGRGRPRKHHTNHVLSMDKKAQGRSKTGCITCRRRKKKCDEAKPQCQCCQKNNVICEGYSPKEVWKSGKQRAAEKRRNSNIASQPLPPLIRGIEDDLDRSLLDHFNKHVSHVLTPHDDDDDQNPFEELIWPMALNHEGLLHSLLCLAATHLLLSPQSSKQEIEERQMHHLNKAYKHLIEDANLGKYISGETTAVVDDPTAATVMVMCLQCVAAGSTEGEYRWFLDLAQRLVTTQSSSNQKFQTYFTNFVRYHNISISVTSLDNRQTMMMEDFQLPEYMMQPGAGALLGVVNSLFGFISKTRHIRDRIRAKRAKGIRPKVESEDMNDATLIDANIREWTPPQAPGTEHYTASMLYKQTAYLYLYRTLHAPEPGPDIRRVVDQGLAYLNDLPSNSATHSILLMPVFILGCAAFEAYQRPDITRAFESLQNYSNLGNIKYARLIVEIVWGKMDARDEDAWDWESIIKEQGWDFLIT